MKIFGNKIQCEKSKQGISSAESDSRLDTQDTSSLFV